METQPPSHSELLAASGCTNNLDSGNRRSITMLTSVVTPLLQADDGAKRVEQRKAYMHWVVRDPRAAVWLKYEFEIMSLLDVTGSVFTSHVHVTGEQVAVRVQDSLLTFSLQAHCPQHIPCDKRRQNMTGQHAHRDAWCFFCSILLKGRQHVKGCVPGCFVA